MDLFDSPTVASFEEASEVPLLFEEPRQARFRGRKSRRARGTNVFNIKPSGACARQCYPSRAGGRGLRYFCHKTVKRCKP